MNKQYKIVDGQKVNTKIEWCDYTSNPIRGCLHQCRWQMPDGKIAICYAESTALGPAQSAYLDGFEHHTWVPAELAEWTKLKTPSRIFLDSMADLMGHWVPTEQIQQVLDTAREASWHTFLCLTKNSPRYLQFDLPPNLWPGSSMPPDFFMGQQLTKHQQARKMAKDLEVLTKLRRQGYTTWVSFEPLSYDVTPVLEDYPDALRWAVIGAASDGLKYHQPDPVHVQRLLRVLDRRRVAVFCKGNLRASLGVAFSEWREGYPDGTN